MENLIFSIFFVKESNCAVYEDIVRWSSYRYRVNITHEERLSDCDIKKKTEIQKICFNLKIFENFQLLPKF